MHKQIGGLRISDPWESTELTDSDISSDSDSTVDSSVELESIDSKISTKKNGIFMMCIVNEHYVLGACIAGYCHRKLLEEKGIKETTDLIIMCDEIIYDKYQKLLSNPMFFDRVHKLDMRIFDESDRYKYSIKYSSWIAASLNKWQFMKFEEYDKAMLVDIALLPVDIKFYDLFDRGMPGLMIRNRDKYTCANGGLIPQIGGKETSYKEYLENIRKYGTIHGKVVTIKPDKKLYAEYVEMTDKLYKDGIYSVYESGPDETSLFYFFLNKEIPVYDICFDYAVVSWDDPELIPLAKAYSFTAMFKPWIKPKILSWPEEILWRDIYDRILIDSASISEQGVSELKTLFKKTIVQTYRSYINANQKTQMKNYNNTYIKRFQKEFLDLRNIKNDDDLFDAIMGIDSKIKVGYYGPLKVEKLMKLL